MDLNDLRRQREELNEEFCGIANSAQKHLGHLRQIEQESLRVATVARNSGKILHNLDEQFEKCTGLTAFDVDFLFFATALQVVRQYVITKFPERLDDQTAAKRTKGHSEEHSNRHFRYYDISPEEILLNPVPFDANIGANGALSGGGKMGHRVTALGHDPVLGLVFGTSNIATSTLTNNRLESFHIRTNMHNRDYFESHANTSLVLSRTKDKLFHEGMLGKEKFSAALCKEIVHLKSDLNTANSLPLPALSVVNPSLATELAKNGFDMCNVVSVGKQMGYAMLINTMIYIIHTLFYDESVEVSRKLYEVRTRKILSYSNVIASASNLIFVGTTFIENPERSLKYLDIGGLIVTCYRIISDAVFIQNAKMEFIENEFFDQIRGTEYDFMI